MSPAGGRLHALEVARIAAPLALILVLSDLDRQPAVRLAEQGWREPVHLAVVVAGALLALYAIHAGTRVLRGLLVSSLDLGLAGVLTKLTSVLLYGLVGLMVLSGLGINVSGLFVGGALTGVILGMAAQASLSNVIAGGLILAARPYRLGTWLRVSVNGQDYRGRVAEMGLMYARLVEGPQEVLVPNSTMVGAVIVLPPLLDGAADNGEGDAGQCGR